MNKKALRHAWTKIRWLKAWHLLTLAAISAVICVFALKDNNMRMLTLRTAVFQADQKNGDVEGALQRLRAYVGGHMNTRLASENTSVYPPIQLKYQYDRLRADADAKANAARSQIYTDAQHYCEQLYPDSFSGGPRVPCIEQYVSSHPVTVTSIPDALYKFDFVSPSWSPDVAGFSLAFAVLLLFLALLRFAVGRWIMPRFN